MSLMAFVREDMDDMDLVLDKCFLNTHGAKHATCLKFSGM